MAKSSHIDHSSVSKTDAAHLSKHLSDENMVNSVSLLSQHIFDV